MEAIRDSGKESVRFKLMGAIRTARDAAGHLKIATELVRQERIDRNHYRLGASNLLGSLLVAIGFKEQEEN
ncbi:hypothetical protein [Endozoicomonas sp. 8E]|uniref:hypothetical protein n=1 Tax=Endozoicomonas sp. 8E TaxID=3035692 RepID=UPI002938DE24|nr:hypothetical protein [Endozoicomonas sp. 8E]WOG28206.1 hypothetical protein P6910_00735 [Endozoicomonas sp. 8E]